MKRSKEEMLQKVQELGYRYEDTFGGCAPGTLLACMEVFGNPDETVYRASTGFSGGLGVSTESQCGSLTGGLMFLGMLFGRGFVGRGSETFDKAQYKAFDLAQELKARFDKEYGSFICKHIHEAKLGRAYKLDDDDDLQVFFENGCRHKCAEVVALGAKWAMEIALREVEKEGTDCNRLLYTAEKDYQDFMAKHAKVKTKG
jgi:C_GCAxxG_C_C family probable redox protein